MKQYFFRPERGLLLLIVCWMVVGNTGRIPKSSQLFQMDVQESSRRSRGAIDPTGIWLKETSWGKCKNDQHRGGEKTQPDYTTSREPLVHFHLIGQSAVSFTPRWPHTHTIPPTHTPPATAWPPPARRLDTYRPARFIFSHLTHTDTQKHTLV